MNAMELYRVDPEMSSFLRTLINRFASEGRPHLAQNIAITWIRYTSNNPVQSSGMGAGWSENILFYPASIVKIIYAVAIEHWIQKDFLIDNFELRRALQAMIGESSNDATSYLVDLLTGTSSGHRLKGERWEEWKTQRRIINTWLSSLNWPELKKINCCQKTWEDSPYGREKDFYGDNNENRNSLTTASIAKILEAVMTDGLLPPPSSQRIKKLLSRSIDLSHRKANPENQIDGFLGEGLPQGTKLWSKAGWMSKAKHDAAWWESPNKKPMLLVVFTQGSQLANDIDLLPAIAQEIYKYQA